MKILRRGGGSENFSAPEKGALKKLGGGGDSKNLYTSKPTGEGGAPKKLNY